MFTEDDLIPISALQHFIFCDRQAALIHIERIWLDNQFTVEGHDLHRIVDEGTAATRREVRIRRSVAITSRRLGLIGKADVIEFRPGKDADSGVMLEGDSRSWTPVPVEYKRGKPKAHRADEVQLCAQAIAIEDTLGTAVPEGFLFYAATRRRERVPMDVELRTLTEETADKLHSLIRSGRTPVRSRKRKCRNCSLLPACLPPKRGRPRSVREYLRSAFSHVPPDSSAT